MKQQNRESVFSEMLLILLRELDFLNQSNR